MKPRTRELPKHDGDAGEGQHHQREIVGRLEDEGDLGDGRRGEGERQRAAVPATKEPIAAVASAAAPRPLRAMRLPSSAVIIEPLSPGVLSRIEVVEPPYIAP